MTDVVTIAINRTDGGTTIKRMLVNMEITPEVIEAELAKRPHMFAGATWEIVPNDYVDKDTDRTFRNAWRHTPGHRKPSHDIAKAREIHRGILRRERAPLLDDLDIAYTLADEVNDVAQKRAVATQKQRLRDITADSRIDAAQTIDDLRALTLDVLIES